MPLRIRVDDEAELEAEWDLPPDPEIAIVFCHPNPLDGGTMRAPLMRAVTEGLVDHGAAVLRFNFRGVGSSTGEHTRGEDEVHDVAAAASLLQRAHPELRHAISGWSFGAVTSLRWQAASNSSLPYIGIAPPVFKEGMMVLPSPRQLRQADRRFILGDRDQFAAVEDLEQYATSIGAQLIVLRGSDHFFYFREDRVVEAMATGLGIGTSATAEG